MGEVIKFPVKKKVPLKTYYDEEEKIWWIEDYQVGRYGYDLYEDMIDDYKIMMKISLIKD